MMELYKYEDKNGYIIVESDNYDINNKVFTGTVVESTKSYHEVGYVSVGFVCRMFDKFEGKLKEKEK